MLKEDYLLWRGPVRSRFCLDPRPDISEIEGIELESLADHDVIRIETEASSYQIRVLQAVNRTVLVRGLVSFRVWTPAQLVGSADHLLLQCLQGIYVGRAVVFRIQDEITVTGDVKSVELCR